MTRAPGEAESASSGSSTQIAHNEFITNSHTAGPASDNISLRVVESDITDLHNLLEAKPQQEPPLSGASEEPGDRRHHVNPIVNPIVNLGASQQVEPGLENRSIRADSTLRMSILGEEAGPPTQARYQGIPPELGSLTAEVIFVSVCSAGLLLFSFLIGDITVGQEEFRQVLNIQNSELPWLLGAFTTPLSLSVVISGSLSDLTPPKMLIVGAFAWLTIWNIIGAFSIRPSMVLLFYIVRAMQGLSIGVLVSASMSILGRVYKPGLRKNRVFSAASATAPFGFWLGAIQGGALRAHLSWIFASNALISGLCLIAGYITIPPLRPIADTADTEAPTIREFDFFGAGLAMGGSICLLFGLTQGSVVAWSAYTYSLVIVGLLLFIAFFFVERQVQRPLIPNNLWKTKGFTPLMVAHFLGYGSFAGAWQFYAIQFWLRIQQKSPLTVALYLLPNAVLGVLATWVVSRTLHIIPGHFIYMAAIFAFALGPIFFLPQTSNTVYWALSFPGVALVTFGPDLSFAAISIYITSNVRRSYQGSAGSLLVTVQNLSSAVMTSLAGAIGERVDPGPSGDIGLKGLRAIWWFGLAAEVVAGLMALVWIRIPKEEEKEHVS